jgi:hypothetical protein
MLVKAGARLPTLTLNADYRLLASFSFVANPRGVLAGHLEGAMNGMFVTI